MHRGHQVQEFAQELGTRLIFIPSGLTDEYQPLGRRGFGSLKQRARRRFNKVIIQGCFDGACIRWALKVLVDVWKRITQNEIIGARDHVRLDEAA
jgi:hypothetical protein